MLANSFQSEPIVSSVDDEIFLIVKRRDPLSEFHSDAVTVSACERSCSETLKIKSNFKNFKERLAC